MDMGYYSAVVFMSCMASLVMLVLVTSNSRLPDEKRKCFRLVFFLLLTAAVAEWLTIYMNGSPDSLRWLHAAVKVVEMSAAPFISLALVWAFRGRKAVRRIHLVCLLNLFLEAASGFCGFIFYFDENNVYQHGRFYWIYMIIYLFSIGAVIIEGIQFSQEYQNRNIGSLLCILAFVMLGIGVHLLDDAVRIDWMCLTINGALLYIYYNGLVEQTDSLTQLLDRKTYDTYLASVSKKAVILQCDIDSFKSINDNYGHDVGDACLKLVADVLKQCYGKYGLCYRIGGDEFCVIITKGHCNITAVNDHFYTALAKEKSRHAELHLTGVSLGYCVFNPGEMPVTEAVRQADAMMYECKKQHRLQQI